MENDDEYDVKAQDCFNATQMTSETKVSQNNVVEPLNLLLNRRGIATSNELFRRPAEFKSR